jgi:hypothetical protein
MFLSKTLLRIITIRTVAKYTELTLKHENQKQASKSKRRGGGQKFNH